MSGLLAQRINVAQRQAGTASPGTSALGPTSAAPSRVYRFDYEGKTYELPPSEFEILARGLVARMRQDLLRPTISTYNEAVQLYNYFVDLNNEQWFVSTVLDVVRGPNRASQFIDMAGSAIARARVQLKADPLTPDALRDVTASLRTAEQYTNTALKEMQKYREESISAGTSIVTLLEITSVACFTVACVAGGAVLAAPAVAGGAGYGAAMSGAIMGGSTTLLSAASGTAGRALAGDNIDMVDEAVGWGKQALLGVLAGGAGSAVASKFIGPVASRLASKLGPMLGASEEVIAETARNMFVGSSSNLFQGALVDGVNLIEGNITTEQVLRNAVTNLIAGGFAGLIQGRLRTTAGKFRQIPGGTEAPRAVAW